MTDAFPDPHSDRLTLRPVQSADAQSISFYRSLPAVARFQFWTVFDEETATQMVSEQTGIAPGAPGTWFQLVIAGKASGTVLGDIALHFRADDERQVELGINLDPAHQRRSFAAEAVTRLLVYVFGTLGKHRTIAITDADNQPAARHVTSGWFAALA